MLVSVPPKTNSTEVVHMARKCHMPRAYHFALGDALERQGLVHGEQCEL